MIKQLIVAILCLFASLAADLYQEKVDTLYSSLDPNSLTELFAFYNLYPDTFSGKKAYQKAWDLINLHRDDSIRPLNIKEFTLDIKPIIALVTRESYEESIVLSEAELMTIEPLTTHLKNKTLKGHNTFETDVIIQLPSEEIDLARAIFLYQFGKDDPLKIRSYEAYLDMMAIQILARLPKNYTDLQALEAINHFIFHEMRYRFPPHSMWTEDVDLYTFLPSVLDSRHGVCLGVSILYLSLSQRIGLPLEIITPPGHIYLSYQKDGKEINIETTARGLNIPTEMYLGINNKTLKRHVIKNVVGLNFMNAAATAWHHHDYRLALSFYQKAAHFLPNYPILTMFTAYNHLLNGDLEEGKALLEKMKEHPVEESLYQDTLAEDYLMGRVNIEGIKAVFEEVDETRDSILEKQAKIIKILEQFPKFREGIFHLAITWLQLGRNKEAIGCLKQYHALDPTNPTVEYYLSALSLQRWSFKDAIKHLDFCKLILKKYDHHPKLIGHLEKDLRQNAPTHLL
jgi:tetratricopeptide (TPR) repeat protein